MAEVVALGELLIDFTESGISESGMKLFEQNPGGAPANVLTLLSNLGVSTAFLGKVGNDMHGRYLQDTLAQKNIDTSGLLLADDVFTTLAFVQLNPAGERTFSFARKPGADTCLTEAELNLPLLRSCRLFHFGSLSLTHEPVRQATLAAIREAKASGAVISYDPNYRELLWTSKAEAMYQMRSVLPLVDVMKISDEEAQLLTDEPQPQAAAAKLLAQGVQCAVVTLGSAGALAASSSGTVTVPGYQVPVCDTTGAGDAFWGGFLYCLLQNDRICEWEPEHLYTMVRFANAAAACCVQKRGAIPAMPRLADIQELI